MPLNDGHAPRARLELDRLARRTARVYSLAWSAALVALATFAVVAFGRARDADFDARLAVHATAVYGLTYFDAQGRYHVEPLVREPDIVHGPFDIYVVDSDDKTLLYATEPRRYAIDPNDLHAAPHDAVLANGQRIRVLTKTTFDDADRPRATIVVAGDPAPHRAEQTRFTVWIVMATAALAALGVLVARVMTERTLRPARRALEVRERFLQTAAHELRTPVTGLVAAVEAGSVEGPIAKLTHEASRVLEQVLAYARLDADLTEVHAEPLRLDLLVESLASEDIAIEAEPSIVRGDPRLLEVAIRNLLSNAERHGGGVRAVHVANGRVSVRDAGPGYPAGGSRGWGLGLGIVQRIAAIHGGTFSLRNHPDGGAVATFEIPITHGLSK
ncbi:ATP-binding protein [Pendulispora brunnea]|uniref:histidine kinase n=1 Tax=Pendulispora brunnea TaxID=2905690 RepID=A0ABZ2KA15_9BACT